MNSIEIVVDETIYGMQDSGKRCWKFFEQRTSSQRIFDQQRAVGTNQRMGVRFNDGLLIYSSGFAMCIVFIFFANHCRAVSCSVLQRATRAFPEISPGRYRSLLHTNLHKPLTAHQKSTNPDGGLQRRSLTSALPKTSLFYLFVAIKSTVYTQARCSYPKVYLNDFCSARASDVELVLYSHTWVKIMPLELSCPCRDIRLACRSIIHCCLYLVVQTKRFPKKK